MRSSWSAKVVEPGFIALTEGIWVAVLYLLFEIVGRTPITIPPLAFVVLAGVAAAASPHLDRFGSARWQVVTLTAVVVGVIGTLLGPGVITTLLAGDPAAAFAAHPGGWLLGLAVFRGLVEAGSFDDPDRAGRPFVRGVLVLTAIWLYSGPLPAATVAAFQAAALGPTLVFATVGAAAIGLRRVHAIAAPAGIEWWRNRGWLAALAALVLLLAIVAILVAGELVVAIPAVLGLAGFAEVAIFGLVFLGLVGGSRGRRRPRQSSIKGYLVLAAFLIVGAIIYRLLHPDTNPPASAGGAPHALQLTSSNGTAGVVIIAAVLIGIAIVAILLAQSRHGPLVPPEMAPAIDNSGFEVEQPGLGWLRRARARLFGHRPAGRPASAEAAYLATLTLLEPLRELRRLPHETPQAHASRIRRDGVGRLELDLLAADYELSRWGARRLSGRETRRAIGRWERARTWIAAEIQAQEAARQHAQERAGGEPA